MIRGAGDVVGATLNTTKESMVKALHVAKGSITGVIQGVREVTTVTVGVLRDTFRAASKGTREVGGDVADAGRGAVEGAMVTGKSVGQTLASFTKRLSRGFLTRIVGRVRFTANVLAEGAAKLKVLLPRTSLGSSAPVRFVARVIQKMRRDDAVQMAASVSYFAILSFFPLIVGLSAIIGIVADSPGRQESMIGFIVDFLPGSEEFVRDSLEEIEGFDSFLGFLAVLGLLLTSNTFFKSMTNAVNRAWDIQDNKPFYKSKPGKIAMVLVLGVVFVFSVSITGFFRWATTIQVGDLGLTDILGGTVVTILLKLPAFIISFAMYLFIYRFLPDTKVYWRDVWWGAILAGVLFEIGKNLFLWYLDHFARFDQVYGNVASLVILMVWVYTTAFILILGAQVCSQYARMRHDIEREGLRAAAENVKP